jgi:hypothetical protein
LKTNHGVQFVVVRAYRSVGSVDGNCGPTLAAAESAGIGNRSVYFFPDINQGANASVDSFHLGKELGFI